jgi:hypothetical protein
MQAAWLRIPRIRRVSAQRCRAVPPSVRPRFTPEPLAGRHASGSLDAAPFPAPLPPFLAAPIAAGARVRWLRIPRLRSVSAERCRAVPPSARPRSTRLRCHRVVIALGRADRLGRRATRLSIPPIRCVSCGAMLGGAVDRPASLAAARRSFRSRRSWPHSGAAPGGPGAAIRAVPGCPRSAAATARQGGTGAVAAVAIVRDGWRSVTTATVGTERGVSVRGRSVRRACGRRSGRRPRGRAARCRRGRPRRRRCHRASSRAPAR